MASRKEELQVNIKASDNASRVVDDVAGKLEALESAQAQVDVTATDEASETIEDVTENVETLDGATAEPTLEADDAASDVIEGVSDDLVSLDGEVASTLIEADDVATDAIDTVSSDLETLDGESATVTIDSDGTAQEGIGGITGGLEEIVGGVGGPGLAALSAAGFLAIGAAAADAILDVDGLAKSTGGSLEEVSRLKEAWEQAGGNIDTLERNIIRANEKIRESPALANALGIEIDENTSAYDIFVGAVSALNSGQFTTSERLALAMEVFGSRGVLTINDLQTRVGDLGEFMAGVGENEIITQEQVDQAIQFEQSWDAVEDAMAAIGREILPTVAAQAERIAGFLNSWPIEKLIGGFEVMGANVSLIEAALGADGGNVSDTLADATAALETLLGLGREKITFPLIEAWRELKTDLADNGEIDSATDAVALLAEASGKSEDEIIGLAGGADELAAAVPPATESIEDQVGALEAERDALIDARDAMLDKIDAQREATDDVYAARDAERDFRAQVEDTAETLADAEASADDQAEALDELALSAADAADGQVELLDETASATEKIDTENQSLIDAASQLSGPMRDAILDYVGELNEIPPETMTKIEAALDRDDIDEANRLLAETSKRRLVAFEADAIDQKVSDVDRELNNLGRTRYVNYVPTGPGGGRQGGRGRNQPMASGGPVKAGTPYTVGERGTELFVPQTNGTIIPAHHLTSAASFGAGGGGAHYDVNINMPPGSNGQDVLRALQQLQRRQGPLPLRVSG